MSRNASARALTRISGIVSLILISSALFWHPAVSTGSTSTQERFRPAAETVSLQAAETSAHSPGSGCESETGTSGAPFSRLRWFSEDEMLEPRPSGEPHPLPAVGGRESETAEHKPPPPPNLTLLGVISSRGEAVYCVRNGRAGSALMLQPGDLVSGWQIGNRPDGTVFVEQAGLQVELQPQ